MKSPMNPLWLLLLTLCLFAVGEIVFILINATATSTKTLEAMPYEKGQGVQSATPISSETLLDISGKQLLPAYIDLSIGGHLRIRRNGGEDILLQVKEVVAESTSKTAPRSRVLFDINGKTIEAYCGMLYPDHSGIGPVDVDGIRINVEITKIVFSRISWKKTFNSYTAFRLTKDVRLAIWDPSQPIMATALGVFVVDQPAWTRQRYGNWLHRTNYGIHSAIDIFATTSGVPEKVISPVDGVSYCYHKDALPDSETIMKHVNIYSSAEVGPHKEKILFRFLHLSRILVKNGEHVRKGQVIGYTGHTGFKAYIGDHLHFEIRLNPSLLGMEFDDNIMASIPVNPYPFLLEWWKNNDGYHAESN
jgi:hypothetical protein